MTQGLGTFADLAEELSSVPSTHVKWLKTGCASSSRGCYALLWPPCALHSWAHTRTQTQHIDIIRNKTNLKKVLVKYPSQPEDESLPNFAIGMGLSDYAIQASQFTDETQTQTSDLPKVMRQINVNTESSKGHHSSFSYVNFSLNIRSKLSSAVISWFIILHNPFWPCWRGRFHSCQSDWCVMSQEFVI